MTYRQNVGLLCGVSLILSAVALVPGPIVIGLFLGLVPGLILMLAPYALITGVLLLAGSAAFSRLPPTPRIISYALSAAALLALDTALGHRINAPLEQQWNDLARNDHTDLDPASLQGARHVAIITKDRKTAVCTGICQRLLYNGSVDAVSVGPVTYQRSRTPSDGIGHDDTPLDMNETVMRFHIERRDACPAADLPRDNTYPDDGGDAFGNQVASRVKARVAKGECLIGEPSTLAANDLVAVQNVIRNGHKPYVSERWDLHPDSLYAQRVSVYRIHDSASSTLIFRTTSETASFVVVPLLIGVVVDPPIDIELGIARVERSTAEQRGQGGNAWSFFAAAPGFNIGPIAP